MKVKLRVIITNDKNEDFMGIGVLWLLENIKKHKSINSAAKDMNMSYSKAIKILNALEKNLGQKVITRNHGGNERYGAELTSFGVSFVNKYNAFHKKIKVYAEKEFIKFDGSIFKK